MKKILIEVIISNQCNKRCEYCDLDFRNQEISDKNIDKFLETLRNSKEEISLNFFGWEPLLNFEKIKKISENIPENVKKLSIWTNWRFLDLKKWEYFKDKNFNIYLSVDSIDNWKLIDFDLVSKFQKNIFINFILDPDYINFEKSKKLWDFLIEKWFKKFNLMPVYTTKKWTKNSLIELQKISNYFSLNKKIKLNKYSYFNGISSDLQFILDTDWYFYQDVDSLLWLQKQYKIIPEKLKKEINEKTKIWELWQIKISELLEKNDPELLKKILFSIPESLNQTKINQIISLIINQKINILQWKK